MSLYSDLIFCVVFFRKPTRPSFIDKAGCTQQYESELSLRSFAQLFPLKEGSTSLLGLLPSGKKRKPLRYKVDGPSEVSSCLYAGWDRFAES